MAIEIRELPGEPILIVTVIPPLKTPDDALETFQLVVDFKKRMGGHICRIIDFSRINMTFAEAVVGMASERNIEGGINDPDVSTIYISSNAIVKMGVDAFQNQEQYGKVNLIGLFTTVDEAIECARADIQKRA